MVGQCDRDIAGTAGAGQNGTTSPSVPKTIEVMEERRIPPLVDEIAASVASSIRLETDDRPLVYTVDGRDVTCSSESPFTFSSSTVTESKRLIGTVPRRTLEAPPFPIAALSGLVAIPSANTTATIVDLFVACLTSIVGQERHAADVAASLLSSFGRRTPPVELFSVACSARSFEQRIDSVADACTAVGSSNGPTVVFVDGDQISCDAFERLIVAVRRHGAAGILTTAAHPDARVVLVAGEMSRCSVLVRTVTPKAAQRVGPGLHRLGPPPEAPRRRLVEVAILGPTEIRNTAEPLGGHPLLSELVVYLAMHQEGATTSAWETAIWPNRRMPQQTIANRLSEARRALGDADDGRPRLRKVDERHLIADVTTDWDAFRSLSEMEDAASWRRALELVRGRPFGDLHEGQWALLEGFSAEIEHAISSLALRYGGYALRTDDPDAATWAAHRGLRATPWDERLHRLLMEAADANGDRAGVEATLRHLALVLEIDGDPLRVVHPETARLYERLLGLTPSRLSGALA